MSQEKNEFSLILFKQHFKSGRSIEQIKESTTNKIDCKFFPFYHIFMPCLHNIFQIVFHKHIK